MTREEILSKEAGPETDALVCTGVMGYTDMGVEYAPRWQKPSNEPGGVKVLYGGLPPYSTDIAVAMEVLKKLAQKKGAKWYIETNYYDDGKLLYWVLYDPDGKANFDYIYEHESLPFAICILSLLAVMEEG